MGKFHLILVIKNNYYDSFTRWITSKTSWNKLQFKVEQINWNLNDTETLCQNLNRKSKGKLNTIFGFGQKANWIAAFGCWGPKLKLPTALSYELQTVQLRFEKLGFRDITLDDRRRSSENERRRARQKWRIRGFLNSEAAEGFYTTDATVWHAPTRGYFNALISDGAAKISAK